MDFVLIHVSRDSAFHLRNKLSVMKIPYKDLKVEVIGVEEEYYDKVLKILSEIQKD